MTGHKITVREPNGSLRERTMQEALAELGARVLMECHEYDRGGSDLSAVGFHAVRAARSLGLLVPDQREVGS